MPADEASCPYSSPPCYAHEFESVPLDDRDLLDLLNGLLRAERSAVHALAGMAAAFPEPAEAQALLAGLQRDGVRFCRVLGHLIGELGGAPPQATGNPVHMAAGAAGLTGHLESLARNQARVLRQINEALPRVRDASVHAALREMRDAHCDHVDACAALAGRLGSRGASVE